MLSRGLHRSARAAASSVEHATWGAAKRVGDVLMRARRMGELVAVAEEAGQELAIRPEDVPTTLAAAYETQRAMLAHAIETYGETHAGWKVGATSEAARQRLGLETPFAGPVLGRDVKPGATSVDLSTLGVSRGVELEWAFVMRETPQNEQDSDYTVEQIEAAVDSVLPAMEFIGTRFKPDGGGSEISPAGKFKVICDQGGMGSLVTAPQLALSIADWKALSLDTNVTLSTTDPAGSATGQFRDVLGSPLYALTWAANFLRTWGVTLNPGDIISTGTMTGVLPISPGGTVTAAIDNVGKFSVATKTS